MKRHEDLRDLSDDHHTALVVARRCIRAGESDLAPLWLAVREAMATHFEPHFEIEERWLLPGLEAIGEQEAAERLRQEHAMLRSAVQAAEADPKEATLDALVAFGRLLEQHVRYEERNVFEQTQDRLPSDARKAIARACREQPRVCPTALMPMPS